MKIAIPAVLLAAAALLFAAGCGGGKECTAGSIGTCNEASIACGVTLGCADAVPRELKCTPPDTKLPMNCECFEAGKSVAKVVVETKLPVTLPEAGALANSRCGW